MPYANTKGADQPGPTQSDQRPCCSLPGKYNASSFYIRTFKPLACFCGCAGLFVSTLVSNPKDRFSRDEAHIWEKNTVILYPLRYDSWEASIGYPPNYEWETCKYEGERGHVESMASMAELDQRGHYLQLVVSMNEQCQEKKEL